MPVLEIITLMKQEIEDLKNNVQWFLKAQPGYDENNELNLRAFYDALNDLGVIYGIDVQAGIAGLGETPEDAFRDFVRNWHTFKGFEWINKHK
jgi:hypothetical protein